ncbi:class I SAM-dependent methyltransferase [Falsiroseomonas bella]|uniref:class I SAM-dependent methyltransferase n=1 Tax=Falsiroseomonas bella TaxID=2184016 RepID=UPI001304CB8D|nr:methyltransferase domain-containing protein [Falsiroseomonas bella]
MRALFAPPATIATERTPSAKPGLSPPDPIASDPVLQAAAAPLRAGLADRLGSMDSALAALQAAGRLRPDQLDYARLHRRRFAEAAQAIAVLLQDHSDWPECRVVEIGSSITPMLYKRLFPALRIGSACLFRHPQLDGVVEQAAQLDLEKADLRQGPVLPHRDQHLVMLCEVLEHLVVNPANLFRALAGSLAPGGLLYVTTPNFFRAEARAALLAGRNPVAIYPPAFGPADRFHHHVREYAMAELLHAMRDAGLTVAAAYYSDCWDTPQDAALLPPDALQNLVVLGRRPT